MTAHSPSDLLRETGTRLRPYEPADEAAVLELINADRIPGQPPATGAMLADALAGRSVADNDWWAELDPPVTMVATGPDPAGDVLGVVSYALRRKDDTGLILWAHCREDPAVAQALVQHAVRAFAPRAVDAFHITSALTLGLESLLVRHRRVTRAALEQAGFAGARRWRYLRRGLPAPQLPRADGVTVERSQDDLPYWQLTLCEGGRLVGEALISTPVDGCGALCWLGVEEHARGQGYGRRLLGSALTALHDLGASQVVLLLDAEEEASVQDVRDRTAAGALYDHAGFVDVDVLFAFSLPAEASQSMSRSSV
ncbi:GNAT family N-acetyltransferase [Streptomyces sp. 8N114]|uniref:GNAT family N-acetyltransferase n=1 Tax=Streptomyces sp. 8N114 TaxID=3457419 RepID=UPI003FD516D0